MKWLGIMLMAGLLAVVPGYAGAQPQGKEAPPPAAPPKGPEVQAAPLPPAATTFTPQARKEYEKKVAADLVKLEDKINDIKIQQQKAPQQLKRTILKSRIELQRLDAVAKNKLATLQKASEKDWGTIKAEMDKAMEDLRQTYKEVEAHLP